MARPYVQLSSDYGAKGLKEAWLAEVGAKWGRDLKHGIPEPAALLEIAGH